MRNEEKEGIAKALYTALAAGDRQVLDSVLHPGFSGHGTEGLPFSLGGSYGSPEEMRKGFWGAIARHYIARAEPDRFTAMDDGRLMVQGRYRGQARATGTPFEAEFIHILAFRDGRLCELHQLTDSERWCDAVKGGEKPLRVIDFSVRDGLAVICLNRPEARNGIDMAVTEDLLEVATRCANDPALRAVLFKANGPAFTTGGDLAYLSGQSAETLPAVLRRMTTNYHEALRQFSRLDVPVVAAVHGAVAGGGLGIMCCADMVLAAAGTRFATGFSALGLSTDGGCSWFLPRLIGERRTAELYYEGRVLEAEEAREWGLLTRVVAPENLDSEATALAVRLASGPTRAYAQMRRLMRSSGSASLSEQLGRETDALSASAETEDAHGAIQAFMKKQKPVFNGR